MPTIHELDRKDTRNINWDVDTLAQIQRAVDRVIPPKAPEVINQNLRLVNIHVPSHEDSIRFPLSELSFMPQFLVYSTEGFPPYGPNIYATAISENHLTGEHPKKGQTCMTFGLTGFGQGIQHIFGTINNAECHEKACTIDTVRGEATWTKTVGRETIPLLIVQPKYGYSKEKYTLRSISLPDGCRQNVLDKDVVEKTQKTSDEEKLNMLIRVIDSMPLLIRNRHLSTETKVGQVSNKFVPIQIESRDKDPKICLYFEINAMQLENILASLENPDSNLDWLGERTYPRTTLAMRVGIGADGKFEILARESLSGKDVDWELGDKVDPALFRRILYKIKIGHPA